MKIFIAYYLITALLQGLVAVKMRHRLEKYFGELIEMVGFNTILIAQILFGFILFPIIVVQEIQIGWMRWQNKKLKARNDRLREENRLEIRKQFNIKIYESEDKRYLYYEKFKTKQDALGEYIDWVASGMRETLTGDKYYLEVRKEEIRIRQLKNDEFELHIEEDCKIVAEISRKQKKL